MLIKKELIKSDEKENKCKNRKKKRVAANKETRIRSSEARRVTQRETSVGSEVLDLYTLRS